MGLFYFYKFVISHRRVCIITALKNFKWDTLFYDLYLFLFTSLHSQYEMPFFEGMVLSHRSGNLVERLNGKK